LEILHITYNNLQEAIKPLNSVHR